MNGKYVVQIFGKYYKSTDVGGTYVHLCLAHDIVDATKYENKADAEEVASIFDGKIMKINLKLEEV